jgi:hypothetical protein
LLHPAQVPARFETGIGEFPEMDNAVSGTGKKNAVKYLDRNFVVGFFFRKVLPHPGVVLEIDPVKLDEFFVFDAGPDIGEGDGGKTVFLIF